MQLFTATEYLQIDIANSFGLDNENWLDRLLWFTFNEPILETLVKLAKEPAQYYAGVQAFRKVQNGEAIGYAASLDATSSGLQVLACITGDRKAAEICNVVDVGSRKNAYTVIFKAVGSKLNNKLKASAERVKKAIMTSLYSSQRVPLEVFGPENIAVFEETMDELAHGPWQVTKAALEFWDPTKDSYQWVMPDGFIVDWDVMVTVQEPFKFRGETMAIDRKIVAPKEKGRALGAHLTHSIDGLVAREMQQRCMYSQEVIDEVERVLSYDGPVIGTINRKDMRAVNDLWQLYRKSGYLSVTILNHIDIHNSHLVEVDVVQDLIDSLPPEPFQLLVVHDAFRFHPNFGNDVRYQYNNQLSLLAKSNMLEYLLEEITGTHYPVTKLDPDLWKDILNADYALS